MRMHYYHEDLSRSKVSRHCNGDKPINFFSHLLQTDIIIAMTEATVSDLCCCSAAVVWSADHIHTEPLHSAARPSEISVDKSPPRGEPPG